MQRTVSAWVGRQAPRLVIAGLVVPGLVHAAPPNIGTAGGTGFSLLAAWMQNFVNFMAGPFGTAVVLLSVVLAFAAWAVLPREGIVGPASRGVVAGLVIFNASVWLSTLSGQ